MDHVSHNQRVTWCRAAKTRFACADWELGDDRERKSCCRHPAISSAERIILWYSDTIIWSIISDWCFQTFFIFHNIWDNHQPDIQAIYYVGRFCGHKFGQFWPKTPIAHVRLGVLCITLELILNPLHSFVELWPRGRLGALAVIEVRAKGGNRHENRWQLWNQQKGHDEKDTHRHRRFKGTKWVLRLFHIFPT